VEQFARAFLADDIDGMVTLVTRNAWFRMPPARQEYHGPELIGAFLAAVSEGHSGQSSRLIATRANGEPAFGPITSTRSRVWSSSPGCWCCRWRARGSLS
jgi:RNA polymerase sigma-70 factor, ECF subfamily